ncbi:MAG: EamA family transporter [Rhodospirillales bacterium]
MSSRPFLWVLLLSVVWSASWPLIKFVGHSVPPMALVIGRMAIAACCLVPYLYFSGSRLPAFGKNWGKIWGPLLIIAVIGNAAPYTLVAWGQQQVPSGLSAVLVGTMPVWTVLIAHFFSKGARAGERLNAMKLTGALSGFAGIVLLVGPAALAPVHDAFFGELALIAAALCWACGTIYTSFVRVATPDQSATATALLAVVVLLPVSALWEQPWSLEPSLYAMLGLLALGVGATALGTILLFRIISGHGPTMVSMVMYLNPALAVCWGALFFGETLELRHVAAFACILAGLLLIDRGRRRAYAAMAQAKRVTIERNARIETA